MQSVVTQTFITICRDNKIAAELVALITGKTAKIIEKHYYKVDPERAAKEYNRVWVDPVMKVAENEILPLYYHPLLIFYVLPFVLVIGGTFEKRKINQNESTKYRSSNDHIGRLP